MNVLAALLLAQAAPQVTPAEALVELASSGPQREVESAARRDAVLFREAIGLALARSVRAGREIERDEALAAARRLAGAHASTWDDPFWVGQLARFTAQSPTWQREKVAVDSLRRAGAAVFLSEGFAAAAPVWRASLGRARAIADTASMAAALQNLGAGFLRESMGDSAGVYLAESERLARAVGDLVVAGNALGALHFVSLGEGDLLLARRRLVEASELRRRSGDTRGAAADLNSLGLMAWEVGDVAGARRDFEAALDLNRQEGRPEIGATNLTNLAALASMDGDFGRALALYREALETYRTREMWPDVADVLWGLGQLELRRGDYPAARSVLEEALAIYERIGSTANVLSVRRDLAGTLTAMGEMQGAIDHLRVAEDESEGADVPPDVLAGVALARADLYVALNAFDDAERQYGVAERLFGETDDAAGQAEARQGQGSLLLEREEFARAEQILSGAARAQQASENRRGAALTLTLLAQARAGQGDVPGARTLLGQAAAELAMLGDAVGEAYAMGELAGVEADEGLTLVADSIYALALARLGALPAPGVRWRLHLGRALAARSLGTLDAAVRELRSAAAEIERTAESFVLPERRSAYGSDKSGVYAQLALTERMRDRLSAAFDASERLRARETLELLDRGRTASRSGIAGDLMEREQDLRVRVAELTGEVEPGGGATLQLRGPDPGGSDVAASEALEEARAAYAELLLEMRERAPREAELLAPAPASWRDVARRLAPQAALIEYLVTDSGSVAFVITSDTLAAVDLGIRRRDLARLVQFARGLLDAQTADRAWEGPLRRLHQYLIEPAEDAGLLRGVTELVLVPHAELHYLPFAALRDEGGRYLVERYALGLTPSASVWLALGDRAERPSAGGVLALAPRTDALPASGREVASVARLSGPGSRVLRGAEASEEAFRRLAGDQDVLHLATYGVLNSRSPLFSFIDLGPGGGHDGRLEVHEVFGLELSATLVVLSACETGLGSGALADVPGGDDWIGLTRAFLHAGAARVAATLWAVEDEASARLMEHFFEARARGEHDLQALASAQRRMLGAPATAHPFYWAGTVLTGEVGADDR